MNKERTILVIALISSAVCLGACRGAKKEEPTVTETSPVITTVSETTQPVILNRKPLRIVPDGETGILIQMQEQEQSCSASANTVTAEYNAEVGASYPMRYENDAVYCHDPSTGEKKTGYIRINGITLLLRSGYGRPTDGYLRQRFLLKIGLHRQFNV